LTTREEAMSTKPRSSAYVTTPSWFASAAPERPERTAWLKIPAPSSDHSKTSASALVDRKTPTFGAGREPCWRFLLTWLHPHGPLRDVEGSGDEILLDDDRGGDDVLCWSPSEKHREDQNT